MHFDLKTSMDNPVKLQWHEFVTTFVGRNRALHSYRWASAESETEPEDWGQFCRPDWPDPNKSQIMTFIHTKFGKEACGCMPITLQSNTC